MKSSFHTKLWAVALVLGLALSVQAAGASPVDTALDRDQEFLDTLTDLADRMEQGQLNGEWFFHEMDRLYVKFAPDFVEIDLNKVTKKQRERSRKLRDRKLDLEIRLYQLGFSSNGTGRYPIAYKILNLDAVNNEEILLDQLEAYFNTVEAAMRMLSYRQLSEEEAALLFERMAGDMERTYQDVDSDYKNITADQLCRFQQLELRMEELEQLFY